MTPRIIALIPCRTGSKRIPHKNYKYLGGKPLFMWTVEAAQQSGIFDRIVVCHDGALMIPEPGVYGLEFIARKPSADDEPDIVWVKHVLNDPTLKDYEAFAILRPTSPFRSAQTIRDAWRFFQDHQPADSLRAVRFTNEPPQKMWVLTLGSRMVPLLPFHHPRIDSSGPMIPWHSSPTQSLPSFVVQTAALEVAWTRTVREQHSISGTAVVSYFMPEREDIDINTPEDWDRAERHLADLQAISAAQ